MTDASFEIIGPIRAIDTIATGRGIRDLAVLQKLFGTGHWRKLKGFATVRLEVRLPKPKFTGMKRTGSASAG